MGFVYRGRRINYDNIAKGSAWLSPERVLGGNGQTVSDTSLYNVAEVSPQGNVLERLTKGSSDLSTVDNISNASLPGPEDNENSTASKYTSDGEDVEDAG